MRNPVC